MHLPCKHLQCSLSPGHLFPSHHRWAFGSLVLFRKYRQYSWENSYTCLPSHSEWLEHRRSPNTVDDVKVVFKTSDPCFICICTLGIRNSVFFFSDCYMSHPLCSCRHFHFPFIKSGEKWYLPMISLWWIPKHTTESFPWYSEYS